MRYSNVCNTYIKKTYHRITAVFTPPISEWPIEKIANGAMKMYKAAQGYSFNIDKPELFSEKVIWYKVFWNRDGLVNVVDKYLFKGYLESKVGSKYVVPLYGVWTSVGDLIEDWDKLPKSFCLKSTLKSDSQFIKIVHDKDKVDLNELKKEVKQWLVVKNTLINSYCRAYYQAVPRIIAEELISGLSDQLYDYKFFCFNGKPECIYTYANRFENEKGEATDDYALTFYDLNWNRIEAHIGGKPNAVVPKPIHFNEMLDVAGKLSKDFPFVRVDFYETKDAIYVGEMTLYPSGGMLKYEPREFNKYLGDLFIVPYDESVKKG